MAGSRGTRLPAIALATMVADRTTQLLLPRAGKTTACLRR
jgi:hypothetical protein